MIEGSEVNTALVWNYPVPEKLRELRRITVLLLVLVWKHPVPEDSSLKYSAPEDRRDRVEYSSFTRAELSGTGGLKGPKRVQT